jgi:acyl-CoA synthetase (AMP-forming)/AMP-acid ligase II
MDYNLADLFEAIADRVPERTALVCGAQRRRYDELEERANRLAHGLQQRGVGPGEHVALYLGNCVEYIEAMIACFKIRAVPINVNFRYVEEELRYLVDDSESVAILHHRELAPRVAAVRARCPSAPWLRRRLSKSTNASRSAGRKWARPAAKVTKGSGAPASVQVAGSALSAPCWS